MITLYHVESQGRPAVLVDTLAKALFWASHLRARGELAVRIVPHVLVPV